MKMLILGEILDYILASQRYQHFEAEMSLENVKTISFSDPFESNQKYLLSYQYSLSSPASDWSIYGKWFTVMADIDDTL